MVKNLPPASEALSWEGSGTERMTAMEGVQLSKQHFIYRSARALRLKRHFDERVKAQPKAQHTLSLSLLKFIIVFEGAPPELWVLSLLFGQDPSSSSLSFLFFSFCPKSKTHLRYPPAHDCVLAARIFFSAFVPRGMRVA